MKTLKFIFILPILIVLSCGKDDNEPDPTPQEITIPLTVDFDGLLALPPGSEASSMVTVGQQSSGITNEEFTTVVNLNDKISWELESNNSTNDILLFDAISIVGGALWVADSNYFKLTIPPNPGNLPYRDYEIQIDKARPNQDIEVKYNINFYAERNGLRFGPYYVDPKIQIRRTN